MIFSSLQNKVLLRLSGSAVTWTAVFALLFCICALFVPNRLLNASDGVTSRFRGLFTKLDKFLPSKERPDIVVLGSSLVLTPAIRCDDKMAGKPPCFDRVFYDHRIPEYTESRYLEQLLKKSTGIDASIKNLGVASSIMSDHYAIFRLMLREGKRPKLIVLGLAPRDFLDNSQQHHLETPTRQFVREFNEPQLGPSEWSAKELQESAGRVQHRIEKVITSIKRASTDFACRFSKRPERVEYRTTTNTHVGERTNLFKDLQTYRKLYNPPNFTMLTQQNRYLRKLLDDAHHYNIAVIVINMPLTKPNIGTLDPRALESYESLLSAACHQCGAEYVNLGSADGYSLKDFEDCCHLNASGGEKLYARLVAAIVQNDRLIASLSNSSAKSFIAEKQPKPTL